MFLIVQTADPEGLMQAMGTPRVRARVGITTTVRVGRRNFKATCSRDHVFIAYVSGRKRAPDKDEGQRASITLADKLLTYCGESVEEIRIANHPVREAASSE